LALQYKVFYFVGKAVMRGTAEGLSAMLKSMNKESAWLNKQGQQKQDDLVEDSASEDELVKWWMWLPLLIVVIICFCVVLGVQFGMPVGESILAVFLAFFFSFLAVQCNVVTGKTSFLNLTTMHG